MFVVHERMAVKIFFRTYVWSKVDSCFCESVYLAKTLEKRMTVFWWFLFTVPESAFEQPCPWLTCSSFFCLFSVQKKPFRALDQKKNFAKVLSICWTLHLQFLVEQSFSRKVYVKQRKVQKVFVSKYFSFIHYILSGKVWRFVFMMLWTSLLCKKRIKFDHRPSQYYRSTILHFID